MNGGVREQRDNNAERLPGFYFFNLQTHTLDVFDDVANSAWRSEPPFESEAGSSRWWMTILPLAACC